MASFPCAAFSDAVDHRWTIPVKNTFINFDLPPAWSTARLRSSTCPPSLQTVYGGRRSTWEDAAPELCHAMAPMLCRREIPRSGRGRNGTTQATLGIVTSPAEDQHGNVVDAMSEMSTASSERVRDKAIAQEPDAQAQTWTNVPARRKPKQPLASAARNDRPARAESGQSINLAPALASSVPARSKGHGKGMSYFRRIDVGVIDDPYFRVVQRLIGPKGEYMRDIVKEAYNAAKIWIVGRGSRSWEDDVGPLTVCIGASNSPAFDIAVSRVQDRLARVREDYRIFKG